MSATLDVSQHDQRAIRSARLATLLRHAGASVRHLAHQTAARPVLAFSIVVLLVVLAAALFPGLFTDQNPIRGIGGQRLLPPSLAHPFGTDQLGRDLFARVVYGTSHSVKAIAVAVALGFAIGAFTGLLAGFLGGWVDDVLMRVIDVLLAVPTLLISLAIINALGFGMIHIAIAVGVGSIAGFARLMRSEVLKVRSSAYVEAATFAGLGHARILLHHVLPNALGPVLVLATLELGWAILGVSALSFLGFGPPPPTPEWGLLVAGGRDFMATAWWLTFFPGLVIALTVFAANQIARAFDGSR